MARARGRGNSSSKCRGNGSHPPTSKQAQSGGKNEPAVSRSREVEALVRRVFGKDRRAAEAFVTRASGWIMGLLRDIGVAGGEREAFERVRRSFVSVAVKGFGVGEQTDEQLRRTLRGICEIQCEGLRLERLGFIERYARRDLDAAKEIFNGIYRVLREALIRRIRQKRAQDGEEEILQRVFFALWKNLSGFRIEASFRAFVAWVYVVAKRQTAQWWREQDTRGVWHGIGRKLTRSIGPDDAGFDWGDPEVINAWLEGAVADAARSFEDRYLADDGRGDEDDVGECGDDDGRAGDDSPASDGGDDAESGDQAGDLEWGADDTGRDIDEACELGDGSFEASVRAAEAWRQGVLALLEQPVAAVLASLGFVIGEAGLDRVVGAVEGLPRQQRRALMGWLILGAMRGITGREVAEFLGMNHSSFRGWLQRGRLVLGKALADAGWAGNGTRGEAA